MSEHANRVIRIFNEINTIPRQSRHLEKIHPWLMDWASKHGFEAQTDPALNILIKVPATAGYEKSPTIILQGHMDMVCEKRPDVEHDFQNDPIRSWRDGEWLRGEGTSLGADNGIALALFFDLLTDPEREHPPLEVLITSDEETGLVGAQKLQPGFLSGSVLLNLDSEDEGLFTIGCAGGMDTNIFLPHGSESPPEGFDVRRILIGGLEGGHSGAEIHIGKANANVLLVRVLREILQRIPQARVGSLNGGTAHNAIPREASASVAVPSNRLGEFETAVAEFTATVKDENSAIETHLEVSIEQLSGSAGEFLPVSDASRIIDVLRLIPHGVRGMSARFEGMVETSMNFAVLRSEASRVKVLTNQRSAVASRGADLSEIVAALARLYGGTSETGNNYPAWEPRAESDVLERSRNIWKKLFGTQAESEVTHAGLECGAIGDIFPGLDMISFGPTILQPHSPDERMHIPSVGRVRSFFRELLKSYR